MINPDTFSGRDRDCDEEFLKLGLIDREKNKAGCRAGDGTMPYAQNASSGFYATECCCQGVTNRPAQPHPLKEVRENILIVKTKKSKGFGYEKHRL